ncbi:MAG: SPFH domain-containing protein [Tannerella sp.]|jgi:membrane protease subunit (stomatin/prohibitin family)|nr:SPFH domain-containing protein [Tannerella sp.]
MGLFNSKKEGGLMDVIRCDEKDYLIWKWSPGGVQSRKENAIRYGSQLRVKDGEVAVFVYRQKSGAMQDYVEGPYDETIKTANFPVLTSIVGLAFGGASPFQAEIYFINMAGNIRLPFKIWEGFGVADFRAMDYTVPVTVKGSITFHITDYRNFIKLNRMIGFDLDEFSVGIRDAVIRYVKGTVSNAPAQLQMPLVQIERGLEAINELVERKLKKALNEDFGVTIKRVDLSEIKLDRESEDFRKWQAVTSDLQTDFRRAENALHIQNLTDLQAINAAHLEGSLSVMREEAQRQQRLQSESGNLAAHQTDVQGEVGKIAAASIGQLGSNPGSSMGGGGGGGMNPAAMMTGMMLGGAVGNQMAGMLGNMHQGLNQPQPPTPPAAVVASWHLSSNGAQSGPYTLEQLRLMISAGHLTPQTYVWKAGMGGWAPAAGVPEVNVLFPPPAPPPPPPPPPPVAPVAPPPAPF